MVRFNDSLGAPTEFEVKQVMAITVASSKVSRGIPDEYRVRPLNNKDFVWPSYEEIRKVHGENISAGASINSDNLVVSKTGKIKIPLQAQDLGINLSVHFGLIYTM